MRGPIADSDATIESAFILSNKQFRSSVIYRSLIDGSCLFGKYSSPFYRFERQKTSTLGDQLDNSVTFTRNHRSDYLSSTSVLPLSEPEPSVNSTESDWAWCAAQTRMTPYGFFAGRERGEGERRDVVDSIDAR